MDAFKKILPLHWNKKRFDKEKIKLETLQETKEYQHVKKFFLLKHTNYTVTQIQRVENCFDYLAYFIEREKYILKTDLMPLVSLYYLINSTMIRIIIIFIAGRRCNY